MQLKSKSFSTSLATNQANYLVLYQYLSFDLNMSICPNSTNQEKKNL